jgi:hypothetical protein
MRIAALIALQLITLHRPDGREVHLNPAEITSVAPTRPESDRAKVIVPGARCLIYLSDRHFFAVVETCAEVRRLLEER